MKTKFWMGLALATAATVPLAGCPTAPGTIAIWVVNSSDQFTVKDMTILEVTDETNLEEFPDDVAPNTTRVVDNIVLGDFNDKQLRIDIEAETGGDILDNGDDSVTIPGTASSGDVYVLVVTGNIGLDFNVELVPLDEASKGRLLVKGLLPPIN